LISTEFIPKREFDRVLKSNIAVESKLQLLADMCRLNVLATVKRAGSGHLGTSFSSMDILATLYWSEMNTLSLGFDAQDRDIFLSSKGHDAPAQYAVLYAAGILDEERFLGLRRLGGTPGHPDVNETPGIEANTGSLGMGISKGKGILHAKRLRGSRGRAVVLTGDGEWQEGQNYEALQSAVVHELHDLLVIVDHNKVQSDRLVTETLDLGDLQSKIEAFGWHVGRCDGNDIAELLSALDVARSISDRPKLIIADTIKGKGVTFMEHPVAMQNGALYKFHSGAPDDAVYHLAHLEVRERVSRSIEQLGFGSLATVAKAGIPSLAKPNNPDVIVRAYGECLVELAEERADLIVLDADLALDCQLLEFQRLFPERFIECGISEQDMVSTASGLALQGFLPVVNSFGVFLAARANEQIYNQNTERTKVIYACNFAGLLPAGPGHSHQSLRDVSLFGALPNVHILQPANPREAKQLLRWAASEADASCLIRMNIGPSPRSIEIPEQEVLRRGFGRSLIAGNEVAIIAYGPVMLNEALKAAELLAAQGRSISVINMPWLNYVADQWLHDLVRTVNTLLVVEDHAGPGGLAPHLLNSIAELDMLGSFRFRQLAPKGIPACGTAAEVLAYHQLDAASIAVYLNEMMPTSVA
jgi:transketolase